MKPAEEVARDMWLAYLAGDREGPPVRQMTVLIERARREGAEVAAKYVESLPRKEPPNGEYPGESHEIWTIEEIAAAIRALPLEPE